MISEDFDIDAHNRKVREFWDEVNPRIRSLDGIEARSVVDRVKQNGVHVCQLGREMFSETDPDWPSATFCSVGGALYAHALSVVGEYDDDFRPRPGFRPFGEIDGCPLFYDWSSREFRVQVGEMTSTFSSTHSPSFGMDADDHQTAVDEIARLRAAVE